MMFDDYDTEILISYQESIGTFNFGKICEDVRELQLACREIALNSLHISTFDDVKSDMILSFSLEKELSVKDRISFVYGMSEGKYYLSKLKSIPNYSDKDGITLFINTEADKFLVSEREKKNKKKSNYDLDIARAGYATKIYLGLMENYKEK